MKISINWIKDFVKLGDIPAHVLKDRMTMSTAEVEGVEYSGKHFSDVIAARIIGIEPHPNADNLKLVRVNYGIGEMEVVCGAHNMAVDQVVALAKAGIELPIGKIEAATIRGVRSEGMICAEDELGLSDDHSGIVVFPDSVSLGSSLEKIFGPPDIILEIDNKSLTHRPDLWGHIGMAREFSAVFKKPFNLSLDKTLLKEPYKPDPLRIDNRAPELCPRYSALVVRNVEIKPSPEWIQQRLRAVGLRPINNMVDVTNFVMLEHGQPMHAFDRRQIEGDVIVIRRAEEGEKFDTLDEREHVLHADDIVIADAERAVALGGVMGGLNSEIVEDTTTIILESANFHPTYIRRTANRLDCRTDSAQRFEKGLDPANTKPSIIRALELILLSCPDARVASEFLDSWPEPPEPISISIEFEHICERLGIRLPEEEIINILRRLQFGVEQVGVHSMVINVPSYRATRDISIKADIVEEIGRIFGYDGVTPIPPLVLSDAPPVNELRRFEWTAKDILCKRLGFDEVSNYSFTSEDAMKRCGLDPEPCLRLIKPLSKTEDRMRTSLVPHILENIATNQKHFGSFKLFELGRTTHKGDRKAPELSEEKQRVTGAHFGEGDTPFYKAKGAVGEFLYQLGLRNAKFKPIEDVPPWAHPSRTIGVYYGKSQLGVVGELHPSVADDFEFRERVAIFDLDFDRLFECREGITIFDPLRRFPVNPIEITVVVDRKRPVEDIENVVLKSGGDLLVEYKFLYEYAGERLPEGKKAVTYHVVFGARDRTLGREEVTSLHESLISALREAKIPLRGDE